MTFTRTLILSVFLGGVTSAALAMTMTAPGQPPQDDMAVKTQFGLAGTITRYRPAQSLITIDGVPYILRSRNRLQDNELRPGAKVIYNLEQSPSEKHGRVTRMWPAAETQQ